MISARENIAAILMCLGLFFLYAGFFTFDWHPMMAGAASLALGWRVGPGHPARPKGARHRPTTRNAPSDQEARDER